MKKPQKALVTGTFGLLTVPECGSKALWWRGTHCLWYWNLNPGMGSLVFVLLDGTFRRTSVPGLFALFSFVLYILLYLP